CSTRARVEAVTARTFVPLTRLDARSPQHCGPMTDERRTLLHRLARLKTDRASGEPAPHKPLLLLALLDLAESGRLNSAVVPLSAELTYQFLTYWRIVAHRRKTAPD